MQKILIVDDDAATRNLLAIRLQDTYEVVQTGDPKQAMELALEHKPDAIFLDLMMPEVSGLELCQSLRSVSYTSPIPIFIITGRSGAKYRERCEQLGVRAIFEKPLDFQELRRKLADELHAKVPDRRSNVRVSMKVALKLRGVDANEQEFEEPATTENVSTDGFLCSCSVPLMKGTLVEVFVVSGSERYAGKARVVRKEPSGSPEHRYGFYLEEKTGEWVLQAQAARATP